jgi:hypothetical protein
MQCIQLHEFALLCDVHELLMARNLSALPDKPALESYARDNNLYSYRLLKKKICCPKRMFILFEDCAGFTVVVKIRYT